MMKKYIFQRFVIAVLLALWLTGCNRATAGTTAATRPPTLLNTATTTPESSPTPLPTVTSNAVLPGAPGRLELTFSSDYKPGYFGVFSMRVTCMDEENICLDEPELLFERETWILYGHDWSPDGQRIVFESGNRLFIADANGENEVSIPGPENIQSYSQNSPQWSPYGKQIAYQYGDDTGYYRIVIYDITSQQSKFVLEEALYPQLFYWLPGGRIAYVDKMDDRDSLYEQITIADGNGTVLERLIEGSSKFWTISGVTFSPDGQFAAFSAEEKNGSGYNLFISNLADHSISQLTDGDKIYMEPIWSFQGNWIVFGASIAHHDINYYAIKPDGSREIQLTDTSYNKWSPAWRWIP
jgi:hypothetical protein